MTGLKSDWRLEGLQLGVLAFMFLAAALAWPSAPDQIPVHWNTAGAVDRYAGKVEGLLLPPLLATGLYVLLRVLPKVDPGGANYATFRGAYDAVRVSMLVVLAIGYGFIHLWLRGRRPDATVTGSLVAAGLFILLGSLSGKLRPNWFIGIRTPWTLSSTSAWTRTHRLGGGLMVLLGVAILAAASLGGAALARAVMLVGLGLFLVWTMIYSYWVWRSDPDKIAPAGTQPGADQEGPLARR